VATVYHAIYSATDVSELEPKPGISRGTEASEEARRLTLVLGEEGK
jgi:hypothetical protein